MTLNKIKNNLEQGRNKKIKVKDPINAPKANFFQERFLFNV